MIYSDDDEDDDDDQKMIEIGNRMVPQKYQLSEDQRPHEVTLDSTKSHV